MVKNIKNSKHNLKIFRRFDEDIWGHLAVINKPLKVLNYVFEAYKNAYKYRQLLRKKFFFFPKKVKELFSSTKGQFMYKVAKKEREFNRKKRTLRISTYVSLLKLRRFYGNLKKKQFKRVVNTSRVPLSSIKRSFPLLLETRLDVILYRANFFKSIYAARQFISHKKICVNGIITNRCGYKVSLGDFISVVEPHKFYSNIKKNLQMNNLLVNYPAYLEVNFKLGTVIFTKLPLYTEIPFPCYMNLQVMSHKFSK